MPQRSPLTISVPPFTQTWGSCIDPQEPHSRLAYAEYLTETAPELLIQACLIEQLCNLAGSGPTPTKEIGLHPRKLLRRSSNPHPPTHDEASSVDGTGTEQLQLNADASLIGLLLELPREDEALYRKHVLRHSSTPPYPWTMKILVGPYKYGAAWNNWE